jgi:hypothetical protein
MLCPVAGRMTRRHLGRVGDRSGRAAIGRNAGVVHRTPVGSIRSREWTIGRTPRQAIVRAHPRAVSGVSNRVPFQGFSGPPQHRSTRLDVLWYGGS